MSLNSDFKIFQNIYLNKEYIEHKIIFHWIDVIGVLSMALFLRTQGN